MLKIEKASYQGYIWYSDSTKPQVINGDFSLELSDEQNPFVVEGFLYDSDSNQSMSIKYVDGRYLVNKYRVCEEDFNDVNVDLIEYMPNRMPDVDKLLFLQYWEPVCDDLCCGMETLVPIKKVFVGLKQ